MELTQREKDMLAGLLIKKYQELKNTWTGDKKQLKEWRKEKKEYVTLYEKIREIK